MIANGHDPSQPPPPEIIKMLKDLEYLDPAQQICQQDLNHISSQKTE